ncbi:unnamed protein product [Owenia fusiformis]|uniref:Uncharacterized protein n=1 Tax=Owenia fusiformis TaxID=6347 RepID=A0A8J1TD85_OWEFU|nr:unnamed protein product [Owenia fusiformis]
MLLVLILLGVISSVVSQQCECGIFIVRARDVNGIPTDKSSELWRLSTTPSSGCSASEAITCENNCIQTFRNWKANNNMYSLIPGDANNRDYGNYFCASTGTVLPPGYAPEALHQNPSCYDWISSTEYDPRQNLCCSADTWNFWDCPYDGNAVATTPIPL